MNIKQLLRLLLCGLCYCYTGCSKPVSMDELPGGYVADYGPWRGELEMKSNGVLLETVTPIGDTSVVRRIGQWKFDPTDRMVTFY